MNVSDDHQIPKYNESNTTHTPQHHTPRSAINHNLINSALSPIHQTQINLGEHVWRVLTNTIFTWLETVYRFFRGHTNTSLVIKSTSCFETSVDTLEDIMSDIDRNIRALKPSFYSKMVATAKPIININALSLLLHKIELAESNVLVELITNETNPSPELLAMKVRIDRDQQFVTDLIAQRLDERLSSLERAVEQDELTIDNFLSLNRELDEAMAEAVTIQDSFGHIARLSMRWPIAYVECGNCLQKRYKESKSMVQSFENMNANIGKLIKKIKQKPSIHVYLDLKQQLEKAFQYNCYATQYGIPSLQLTNKNVKKYITYLLTASSQIIALQTQQSTSTLQESMQQIFGARSPVGLYNLGNTCWMNSTIQCLKANGLLARLVEYKSDQSWLTNNPYYLTLTNELKVEDNDLQTLLAVLQTLPNKGGFNALCDKYKDNKQIVFILKELRLQFEDYQKFKKMGCYDALQNIYDILNKDQNKDQNRDTNLQLSASLKILLGIAYRLTPDYGDKQTDQQDPAAFLQALLDSLNQSFTVQATDKFHFAGADRERTLRSERLTLCPIAISENSSDVQTVFDNHFSAYQPEPYKIDIDGERVQLDHFSRETKISSALPSLPLLLKRFEFISVDKTGSAKEAKEAFIQKKADEIMLNGLATLDRKYVEYSITSRLKGSDRMGYTYKITRQIGFTNEELTIDASKALKTDKPITYRATSGIVHIGETPTSGHYVCYYRDQSDNKWYCANDTIVKEIDIKEAQARMSEASIIFFQEVKN